MRSAELGRSFPVIAEAMAHVAHLSIRNRGTIGGSLVHADPSAEWPLLVALLDGTVVMEGPDGRREAGADEFFIAPLFTDLGEDELVVAVSFPVPQAGSGQAFDEVARRRAISPSFPPVRWCVSRPGSFARCAWRWAVSGTGLRARTRWRPRLVGSAPTRTRSPALPISAREDLEPESDVHASAEYRLHLVSVLARRVLGRALGHALERARGAGA